jgi:hypothetical protein
MLPVNQKLERMAVWLLRKAGAFNSGQPDELGKIAGRLRHGIGFPRYGMGNVLRSHQQRGIHVRIGRVIFDGFPVNGRVVPVQISEAGRDRRSRSRRGFRDPNHDFIVGLLTEGMRVQRSDEETSNDSDRN